jgi:hypothetical protein
MTVTEQMMRESAGYNAWKGACVLLAVGLVYVAVQMRDRDHAVRAVCNDLYDYSGTTAQAAWPLNDASPYIIEARTVCRKYGIPGGSD